MLMFYITSNIIANQPCFLHHLTSADQPLLTWFHLAQALAPLLSTSFEGLRPQMSTVHFPLQMLLDTLRSSRIVFAQNSLCEVDIPVFNVPNIVLLWTIPVWGLLIYLTFCMSRGFSILFQLPQNLKIL